MNQVIETIYKRRAVRKYKDKKVDIDLVEKIIDAGRMAPSAINKQPWKFYILKDKTQIEKFSKAIAKSSLKAIAKLGLKSIVKTAADFIHSIHDFKLVKESDYIFHGAPVVIFLTAPKENEWAGLDVGMCVQNMMLTAKSFGLDSCPVGLAKFVEESKVYSEMKIPKSDHVLLAVIFGYGDEEPEIKPRVKDNAIYL